MTSKLLKKRSALVCETAIILFLMCVVVGLIVQEYDIDHNNEISADEFESIVQHLAKDRFSERSAACSISCMICTSRK